MMSCSQASLEQHTTGKQVLSRHLPAHPKCKLYEQPVGFQPTLIHHPDHKIVLLHDLKE